MTAVVPISQAHGVAVERFNPKNYLAAISGTANLEFQQQLAGAYDAACASLIGPNDVQKEGTRTFKKKSAWRKLARHFAVDVQIVKVEHQFIGRVEGVPEDRGDFLALVTARAVAPWGQVFEEVGACCTDEETGRRTITVADAIATASTRAANRAVSNLIAMGEVSAEEVRKGQVVEEVTEPAVPTVDEARAMVIPGEAGKAWNGQAGKRLDECRNSLIKAVGKWSVEQQKEEGITADGYKLMWRLMKACRVILDERKAGRLEEPAKPAKSEAEKGEGAPTAAAGDAANAAAPKDKPLGSETNQEVLDRVDKARSGVREGEKENENDGLPGDDEELPF